MSHRDNVTNQLRTLLDEMVNDGCSVETHTKRLKAISASVPHPICIQPTPLEEPLEDFNCVMHAFGLIGRIENPCGRPFGRYYADTVFLSSLIERNVLRPCAEREGALVIWSSAGVIKHAGIIVALGRAVSKWGIGYLYEHGLFEVPTSYGDDVAFYDPLESDDALNHLADYYKPK